MLPDNVNVPEAVPAQSTALLGLSVPPTECGVTTMLAVSVNTVEQNGVTVIAIFDNLMVVVDTVAPIPVLIVNEPGPVPFLLPDTPLISKSNDQASVVRTLLTSTLKLTNEPTHNESGKLLIVALGLSSTVIVAFAVAVFVQPNPLV